MSTAPVARFGAAQKVCSEALDQVRTAEACLLTSSREVATRIATRQVNRSSLCRWRVAGAITR
jgi:hypothetical protein